MIYLETLFARWQGQKGFQILVTKSEVLVSRIACVSYWRYFLCFLNKDNFSNAWVWKIWICDKNACFLVLNIKFIQYFEDGIL